MADKLIRKLTDKATGLAITGATVVARPVDVGASGDISMPETPAGSGIYATASEVVHKTYKIVVNGQDSLDEVTVEPGRTKATKSDGTLAYPLIDRILDSKVTLSSFLQDSDNSPTSATLVAAIAAATGASKRTLVLDADVALDSTVAITDGDLNLDLNGHTLTLSGAASKITSSTKRIRVWNGVIYVGTTSSIIQGYGTNFVAVQFSGPSLIAFARPDDGMTFDGCDGLAALPGAHDGASQMSRVSGGSHGFATASNLRLTDFGSTTGTGRLVKLQSFLDLWYDRLVGSMWAATSWLTSAKRSILDEWVNISASDRATITGLRSLQTVGTAESLAKISTTNEQFYAGIKLGLLKVTQAGMSGPFLRGCLKMTGSGGQSGFTCTIDRASLTPAGISIPSDEWEGYTWDNGVNEGYFAAFVIDAYGQKKRCKFQVTAVMVNSNAYNSYGVDFQVYGTLIIDGVTSSNPNGFYLEFDLFGNSMAGTNTTTTSR